MIHGQNGVSQKAPEAGKASHYISFTRLAADGTLQWKSQTFHVKGLAWMDHEFFSQQLDDSQAGWDWFCVQLENREELMFYRLRKKNGAGDPYSSGTFVDAHGASHFLRGSDFTLEPGATWTSPKTGATYPIAWTSQVPSLGLQLSSRDATERPGARFEARLRSQLLGRRCALRRHPGRSAGPRRRLPRNDRLRSRPRFWQEIDPIA